MSSRTKFKTYFLCLNDLVQREKNRMSFFSCAFKNIERSNLFFFSAHDIVTAHAIFYEDND